MTVLTTGSIINMRILLFLLFLSTGLQAQLLPIIGTRSKVSIVVSFPDSAQFNFNLTAQSEPNWTDVTGNPHTAIRTATGSYGIGISSITTSEWINETGATAANAAGQAGGTNTVFPENVRTSYWFTKYPPRTNPNIRITGLVAGASYTITLIGSRNAGNVAPATRLGEYTLTDNVGSETVDNYDVKGNITNNAVFSNKIAKSDGTIDLIVSAINPQDITNGPYAYLNGLKIKRNS